MTKKDYERAAALVLKRKERAMKHALAPERRRALLSVSVVAIAFLEFFSEEDSRFDHNRFMKACGLSGSEVDE